MTEANIVFAVMVSSTYLELSEHRKAVREAILSQRLFPVAMEDDAALPDKDLIDASLAKVDESHAYVGLIGYRYGQVPVCPVRNPDHLSITELEYRRAVSRGIPLCMFIMHDDHPVPKRGIREESGSVQKLDAFIQLAKKDRIYAEFDSVTDLKVKAIQSLGNLREILAARHKSSATQDAGATEVPHEGRAGQGQVFQYKQGLQHERERTPPMQPVSSSADVDRQPAGSSYFLFTIAFLALSAVCAWVVSLLAAEKDISWIVLILFSLGFVFFAAAGILTLRRGVQQGN